jgi:hypothetical protein
MDVDESSQSDATVTSGKGTPVPEETTLVPGSSKPEPKVCRLVILIVLFIGFSIMF